MDVYEQRKDSNTNRLWNVARWSVVVALSCVQLACDAEAGSASGTDKGGNDAVGPGYVTAFPAGGMAGSTAASGGTGGDDSAGTAGSSGIGSVGDTGGAGAARGTGDARMTSRSNGCGVTNAPADGRQTIDVAGMQREFIVAVPDGYDANTAHKLIFAWHGQTITASHIDAIGYYGLESLAGGTSIFVAAQGLDTSTGVGGVGWDNMNGRDIAFTRAMLAQLRASYCIDNDRIFAVGMSYGGIMSNNVGCAMGDEFRAIAPMAGLGPIGVPMPCVEQVAVWMAYGDMDQLVPANYIDRSRDHWVGANHCDATTQPIGGNGCVAYDGCDAGHPMTWCSFAGGHTAPSFASAEIWAFFSQF